MLNAAFRAVCAGKNQSAVQIRGAMRTTETSSRFKPAQGMAIEESCESPTVMPGLGGWEGGGGMVIMARLRLLCSQVTP